MVVPLTGGWRTNGTLELASSALKIIEFERPSAPFHCFQTDNLSNSKRFLKLISRGYYLSHFEIVS